MGHSLTVTVIAESKSSIVIIYWLWVNAVSFISRRRKKKKSKNNGTRSNISFHDIHLICGAISTAVNFTYLHKSQCNLLNCWSAPIEMIVYQLSNLFFFLSIGNNVVYMTALWKWFNHRGGKWHTHSHTHLSLLMPLFHWNADGSIGNECEIYLCARYERRNTCVQYSRPDIDRMQQTKSTHVIKLDAAWMNIYFIEAHRWNA